MKSSVPRWSRMCWLILLVTAWWVGGSPRLLVSDETEIELYRKFRVPGNLIDNSGLRESLGPGIWHDVFGGISALAHVDGDLYWALADRGPKDGAVDWKCRMHLIRIPVIEEHSTISPEPRISIEKTVLLTDGNRVFHGLAERFEATEGWLERLDPEGIRVAQKTKGVAGNVYVSDEYGPHLMEFTTHGSLLRRFRLPDRYKISNPGLTKQEENAKNVSGRQGNKGLEGLSINADASKLTGVFQSPLLQDSTRRTTEGQKKPRGTNCRVVEITLADQTIREYLYPLENTKNKLNEIVAIGTNEFLVLERDGVAGDQAKFKKLIRINTSQASDIAPTEFLPPFEIPEAVRPVQKSDFIDLLDARFGLAGSEMPEKLESLAFGPDLPDGRSLLLVVSDNDFETNEPTWIYCFAIPRKMLQTPSKQELAGG